MEEISHMRNEVCQPLIIQSVSEGNCNTSCQHSWG